MPAYPKWKYANGAEIPLTNLRMSILCTGAYLTSHYWDNINQDMVESMADIPGIGWGTFRNRDTRVTRLSIGGVTRNYRFEGHGDPTVLLIRNPTCTLVSISGTRGFLDLVRQATDYNMELIPNTNIPFRVPKVYHNRLLSIIRWLNAQEGNLAGVLTSVPPVVFTGFSQGAAIASLLWKYYLTINEPGDYYCLAFDGPKRFSYDQLPTDPRMADLNYRYSTIPAYPKFSNPSHNGSNNPFYSNPDPGQMSTVIISQDSLLQDEIWPSDQVTRTYRIPNKFPDFNRNSYTLIPGSNMAPQVIRATARPISGGDRAWYSAGVGYPGLNAEMNDFRQIESKHNPWLMARWIINLANSYNDTDRLCYDWVNYIRFFGTRSCEANSLGSTGQFGATQRRLAMEECNVYINRCHRVFPEYATSTTAGYGLPNPNNPPMPPSP